MTNLRPASRKIILKNVERIFVEKNTKSERKKKG